MIDGCPAPEHLLRSLLEGLEPDDRADLTAHLAGCAACRDRFEALRALGYQAPEGPPPPPATSSCSADADIGNLVARTLAGDAARTTREHVMTCTRCIHVLDAALYHDRHARQHPPDEPREDRSPARGWRRWFRRD